MEEDEEYYIVWMMYGQVYNTKKGKLHYNIKNYEIKRYIIIELKFSLSN